MKNTELAKIQDSMFPISGLTQMVQGVASSLEVEQALKAIGFKIVKMPDGKRYATGNISMPFFNDGTETDAAGALAVIGKAARTSEVSVVEIARMIADDESNEVSELDVQEIELSGDVSGLAQAQAEADAMMLGQMAQNFGARDNAIMAAAQMIVQTYALLPEAFQSDAIANLQKRIAEAATQKKRMTGSNGTKVILAIPHYESQPLLATNSPPTEVPQLPQPQPQTEESSLTKPSSNKSENSRGKGFSNLPSRFNKS